jgi:hypothetical protein
MSALSKRSVGDTPAFPIPEAQCPGMTYRQWLIGQIANGAASQTLRTGDKAAFTALVIGQADEIIMRLNREGHFPQ